MKTFILWLLIIDAKTGELLDSHPVDGRRLTIAECVEAQVEQGPQAVKDGKAFVFVCHDPQRYTTT